jgi:hypothetical protein
MRKQDAMAFSIRFAIGNRLGAASKYSLIEFCLHVIDRYGLKEHEVATIVTLQKGEKYTIKEKDQPVLEVTRLR